MEGIEGMDDEESPSGSGDGVGREGRQDEGGSFAQPRDQVTVELTQEENDAVENVRRFECLMVRWGDVWMNEYLVLFSHSFQNKQDRITVSALFNCLKYT